MHLQPGPVIPAALCARFHEPGINDAGYPSAKSTSFEMHGPTGEAVVSAELAVLAWLESQVAV